ncbi:MAG: 50S ribosomal protein L11 methyltransferase [Pseudomonadota bacterium]
MTTWTALTTTPKRDAAEALGEALEALDPAPTGVGVFEIEDGSGRWEIGAYFEAHPDAAGLALLAAVHTAAPFALSRLDDRDWVAQVRRELHPIHAGRFSVHGAHDAHHIALNRIGLRIEAAMAFGTGHHATTQGCLHALDRLHRRGVRAKRIADIGCGTGVLAMAAAKLWRARGLASDIDSVAVATARENLRENGVAALIGCVRAAGFEAPRLREHAPYGLVFANILAAPLKALAPAIAAHLAPGGYAVLSGVLIRQAAGVEAVFAGWGLMPIERIEEGEWRTTVVQRRVAFPR